MDFLGQLKMFDDGYDCTEGQKAVDLSSLTSEQVAANLEQFCFQTSHLLAQAQDLVLCRYRRHGATPRPEWHFLGSLFLPRGLEAYFTLKTTWTAQGQLHYRMCIHDVSSTARHFIAQQCMLYSDLPDGTGQRSTASTAYERREETVELEEVLRLDLIIPREASARHSLDMIPRD